MARENGKNILDKEPWHKVHGSLVRELVFGVNDGAVTTMGIVSGAFGAALENTFIMAAGFIAAFAGAVSMAVGTYLSQKSLLQFYDKESERENREVREVPEIEREEIRRIYYQKGFKGAILEEIVQTISADKKVWVDTMMREELGLVKETLAHPRAAAMTMGVAFIAGSVTPLLPFIFVSGLQAVSFSLIIAVAALFIMGAARTLVTNQKWVLGAMEAVFFGVFAAGAGYGIGLVIGALLPLS